jgi:hypothetical protein
MHSRSNGQFSVVTAGTVVASIFQLVNNAGDVVGELGQRTVNGIVSPALLMNTGGGGTGYLAWRYGGLGTQYSVVLAGPGGNSTLTLGTNGASSTATLFAQNTLTVNTGGSLNLDGATVNIGSLYNVQQGGYPLVGVHSGPAASRPGSGGGAPAATDGGIFYETDTNETLQYYSSVGQWRRPWRMPWGNIGFGSRFSNQTGITTLVDIGSLSVTFTAVANRLLRVSWHVETGSSVAGDLIIVWLRDGAGNFVARTIATAPALSGGFGYIQADGHMIVSPPAGAITYRMSIERSSGSGSVTVVAAATSPNYVLVEDIGPNGAPA